MITDTEIKEKGFRAIFSVMNEVEAEKFITLMHREPFDYTKWQQKLMLGGSIDEIHEAASAFRKLNSE